MRPTTRDRRVRPAAARHRFRRDGIVKVRVCQQERKACPATARSVSSGRIRNRPAPTALARYAGPLGRCRDLSMTGYCDVVGSGVANQVLTCACPTRTTVMNTQQFTPPTVRRLPHSISVRQGKYACLQSLLASRHLTKIGTRLAELVDGWRGSPRGVPGRRRP